MFVNIKRVLFIYIRNKKYYALDLNANCLNGSSCRNVWIMKNFPLIQSKFVISNPNESSISLANPFFVCVFVFVIDFLSSCRINFLPLSIS